MNGRQPGGLDRAADAIIGAVESDAPPLRLVLGKYANDKVRKKLATAAKDKKTLSFIMPQKAVEKGVPKPAGDSVTLGRVDAARFAVMRFGGDRTAENEKTGIEKLKTWLSALEDCGKRRTHLRIL
jgi:SOUL heme-binding protein